MESSSLHIRIAGLCGCSSWRRSHPMGSSLSRQQQVGLPDGILWGLRRHHRCDRLKGLDVCYENLGDPSCILVTLCHIMSYHGRIMSYHVISWENHGPMENQVPYLPGPNLWGGEVVCSGGSEATTQSYLAPWIHDWERHLSYLRWTPPPATMFGSVFVQGRTWGSRVASWWDIGAKSDFLIFGLEAECTVVICGIQRKQNSRVPKRGLSILWNWLDYRVLYSGLTRYHWYLPGHVRNFVLLSAGGGGQLSLRQPGAVLHFLRQRPGELAPGRWLQASKAEKLWADVLWAQFPHLQRNHQMATRTGVK